MKAIGMVAILLASLFSGGISIITRINQHAEEAATAYHRKDYIEAIASYNYLLDDLEVDDDLLRLNLAHSYYQAGLLQQATAAYQYLADHPTPHLRALAHLQLGNIHTKQKKYKRALALYKLALMAEPGNDAARYNFELLKKFLTLHPEAAEEQEAPEQQSTAEQEQQPSSAAEDLEPQPKKNPDEQGEQQETDKPAPGQDGQQQQAGASEQQQGDQEREEAAGEANGEREGLQLNNPFDKSGQQHRGSAEEVSEEDQQAQMRRARLRQANMSPEKARLLLDAMRNAELQYIQQLPKKPTRQPDPGKPDW